MTQITKAHRVLFVINLAMLVGFGWVFVAKMNYEFMAYVVVVGGAIAAVWLSLPRVPYTLDCLIGLTLWAGLHLAGGGIPIGAEGRLYDVMIWPLWEHLEMLRYDQVVHVFGFGAATLLMHCLLAKSLRLPAAGKVGLVIVLLMAGLGVGAFNEIVEFIAVLSLPKTGVGSYTNTAMDLCANFVGAILAVIYLGLRGRLTKPVQLAD